MTHNTAEAPIPEAGSLGTGIYQSVKIPPRQYFGEGESIGRSRVLGAVLLAPWALVSAAQRKVRYLLVAASLGTGLCCPVFPAQCS